jgi:hypothetical protein
MTCIVVPTVYCSYFTAPRVFDPPRLVARICQKSKSADLNRATTDEAGEAIKYLLVPEPFLRRKNECASRQIGAKALRMPIRTPSKINHRNKKKKRNSARNTQRKGIVIPSKNRSWFRATSAVSDRYPKRTLVSRLQHNLLCRQPVSQSPLSCPTVRCRHCGSVAVFASSATIARNAYSECLIPATLYVTVTTTLVDATTSSFEEVYSKKTFLMCPRILTGFKPYHRNMNKM